MAALRTAGQKPLLLGALLWVTVAAASLGLQALTPGNRAKRRGSR